MATARDVIIRALRRIGELAAGEIPDATTAQDALAALNRMLASWELRGVRMMPPSYALADVMQLPDGQLDAIEENLAVKLAPEFGTDATASLQAEADRGFRALQAAYAVIPPLRADPAYTQRPGEYF